MSGTSGAGGGILCNDFVDRGRQVDEEVVLEVPGRTSQVSVVGLGQPGYAVDHGQEMRAKTPKRLDDTGDDGLSLRGGVPSSLIFLSGIRRNAGGGKGSRGVP